LASVVEPHFDGVYPLALRWLVSVVEPHFDGVDPLALRLRERVNAVEGLSTSFGFWIEDSRGGKNPVS